MYFCDILVIFVDIFSDYVKNRLHPEGLIWSVQTIRVVHSRPMFWGLKWVPYSPSLVGGGVFEEAILGIRDHINWSSL